jgi:hypothetical protein
MSFDERDPRSHLFEEAGSGFPLLIISRRRGERDDLRPVGARVALQSDRGVRRRTAASPLAFATPMLVSPLVRSWSIADGMPAPTAATV